MPQHAERDVETDVVTLPLPPSPSAPRLARETLAHNVGQRLSPDRLEDAALVLSEVVTNAVRHAGLGSDDHIEVRVRASDRDLLFEVSDPGRGFRPTPRGRDVETGGWGLQLLDRLSDGWGVHDRPGGGSVVWFRMDARD
jgi:anti-sigma regulatory factor (Ser/Thr protein kinase)